MELSYIAGGSAKWDSNFLKTAWNFLIKLISNWLYEATILPTLVIYLREMKTYIRTKIYMQMFIATLLISAETWK